MSEVAPFFADHVGSLLRPQQLLKARTNQEGDQYKTISGARNLVTLRQIEDQAVCEAVRLQEEVGLKVATDGEFRRRSWYQDFVLALNNTKITFVEPDKATSVALPFRDDTTVEQLPAHVVHITGKLKREKCILEDQFVFLRDATRLVPKITIPAPTVLHFWGGREAIDQKAYPDLEEFWSDVIQIWIDEIRGLRALGCTYVQIDDVMLPMMCDPLSREALRRRGEEPDAVVLKYSEVLSRIACGAPDDVTVALHMCRGNNRGKWMAAGGYESISEAALGGIGVDAFFLEYDSDRSGDFAPLRHIPKGTAVVLGLVSTKTAKLESKDELRRRIDEATAYVQLSDLRLSPQCGFASNFMGNPLTYDDQRRKLELVVETARAVWN